MCARQLSTPATFDQLVRGARTLIEALRRTSGRGRGDAVGRVHLALGHNVSFGGRNAAPPHIDMVQLRATMTLDDPPLLVDGAFADGLVSERPELFAVLKTQRGN